jgi:RNA ligase (TIGR02306 family)
MKLATIQRIHSITRHPNVEVNRLDVGKVKEWPVVIPKGEYEDGDHVIFILIDSIVPNTKDFAFMERQKFRVWNAKFKGAPSQGLVMPLSILPESVFETKDGFPNEGDDVSELLGVIKYEKPLDLSVTGDAKGHFPTDLISITDEDNLLSYPETLRELDEHDVYITIKADGSSMTIIHQNGEVRVCSRKLEQKEGTGFWRFAQLYDLPSKLRNLNINLAIQAEACGGKIQGNPIGLKDPTMFVFTMKELDTGKLLNMDEINSYCYKLDIPMVQILSTFKFDTNIHTIKYLQDIANNAIYITSSGEKRPAEGIVIRPTEPRYSEILGKPLSVKLLNINYKQ